jgi:hypothetical protein
MYLVDGVAYIRHLASVNKASAFALPLILKRKHL